MHDDLTKKDIEKMQEELDYRRNELMPELIEEVKRTRAFGDLSENFEYKEAKRAKNRNGSRIRMRRGCNAQRRHKRRFLVSVRVRVY